jgi:hypothetical protein
MYQKPEREKDKTSHEWSWEGETRHIYTFWDDVQASSGCLRGQAAKKERDRNSQVCLPTIGAWA